MSKSTFPINIAREQSNYYTYTKTLTTDIEKLKEQQKQITKNCEEIDECVNLINTLSEQSRKSVLLNISPKCVIPAVIVHTGEYDVQVGTGMMATYSLKQTINYLDRRRCEQTSTMDILEQQLSQLNERYTFETENMLSSLNVPEFEDMPEKIISDKGAAYKTKGGFEIIEAYDEEEERMSKSRRQRIAKTQPLNTALYFNRLDELEKEENNIENAL